MSTHQPIASEQFDHEGRRFFVDLKENGRGRFLKITEDSHGYRNTILVPCAAIAELMECVGRISQFERGLE